jgi:Flp pilus assembly pilin Flp
MVEAMIAAIKNFLTSEEGMELPEYAFAAALVTLLVVGAYQILRGSIVSALERIAAEIDAGAS